MKIGILYIAEYSKVLAIFIPRLALKAYPFQCFF